MTPNKKRLPADFFEKNSPAYGDMSVDGSTFDTDKYYDYERLIDTVHHRRDKSEKTSELYKTSADFLLYHTLSITPRTLYSKISSLFLSGAPQDSHSSVLVRHKGERVFEGSIVELAFDIFKQRMFLDDRDVETWPLDDAALAFEGWRFYSSSKERAGAFFLDCLSDTSVHASIEDREASPAVYQAFSMMLLWEETRALSLKHPLFVATVLSLNAPGNFFGRLREVYARNLVLSDALPAEKEQMAKMFSLLWGDDQFFDALTKTSTERLVISRGLTSSFLACLRGCNKTPSDILEDGDLPDVRGLNSTQIENINLFCDKMDIPYVPTDRDVAQYFTLCLEKDAAAMAKYANLAQQWDFYQRKGVAPDDVSCEDFVRMVLDGKTKETSDLDERHDGRIQEILKSLRERRFLSKNLLDSSKDKNKKTAKRKI